VRETYLDPWEIFFILFISNFFILLWLNLSLSVTLIYTHVIDGILCRTLSYMCIAAPPPSMAHASAKTLSTATPHPSTFIDFCGSTFTSPQPPPHSSTGFNIIWDKIVITKKSVPKFLKILKVLKNTWRYRKKHSTRIPYHVFYFCAHYIIIKGMLS